ncbi:MULTISPECIES: M48 family metallopeptidase [unclassified Brevundimonas]|uniref:M48 family metallopeptidase n=1 Tax=unclassified Brevundimonas TaxID=2622653 RepID=UPI000E7D9FB3|nr:MULTISPECIES: SprT family zinc-dependent metalloprotease [unclassified Brevundimonas]MCK6104852.1 M48 family metallopeptidase [Brevundimonas sp. EYE_349]HBI19628.1 M48 family peptidase [Brevundimonas sp.]
MAYRNGQRLPLDEGGAGVGPVLRLSVNPRARRLSVRIDARAGEAVVIAPSERGLTQAVAFARTKAVWISERLAVRPKGRPLEPGQVISLRGRPVRLEAAPGAVAARLVEEGTVIRSGGEDDAYARRVENLLKREARDTLVERTGHHLRTLGQGPVKVSIADTRSRWGSCSPHNRTIRYSWRVIMAPPPVIDYLAAHEVAHLVHADHSPAYWSVVERLVGDHRPWRKWLKDHGGALHAVGR